MDTPLEKQLESLRQFDGLPSELDAECALIKQTLHHVYRKSRDTGSPSPQAYAELERQYQLSILEARKRAQQRLKTIDRSSLLHRRSNVSNTLQSADKPANETETDSMAQSVTNSMNRVKQNLKDEIDKSILNYQILERSTKRLRATNRQYERFEGILGGTRAALKELWRRERSDQFWIMAAFGLFVSAAVYILVQRLRLLVILAPLKELAMQYYQFYRNEASLSEPISQVTDSILDTTSSLYTDVAANYTTTTTTVADGDISSLPTISTDIIQDSEISVVPEPVHHEPLVSAEKQPAIEEKEDLVPASEPVVTSPAEPDSVIEDRESSPQVNADPKDDVDKTSVVEDAESSHLKAGGLKEIVDPKGIPDGPTGLTAPIESESPTVNNLEGVVPHEKVVHEHKDTEVKQDSEEDLQSTEPKAEPNSENTDEIDVETTPISLSTSSVEEFSHSRAETDLENDDGDHEEL